MRHLELKYQQSHQCHGNLQLRTYTQDEEQALDVEESGRREKYTKDQLQK